MQSRQFCSASERIFAIFVALLLASVVAVQPAQARKFKVLHTFHGRDGAYPTGGLIVDTAGNFYGVTGEGGTSNRCPHGCGTVFKLTRSGAETVLYSFTGKSGDGKYPANLESLTRDAPGNIYGTTFEGGDPATCGGSGCGIVFKLDEKGKETVLHTFGHGRDGLEPASGLVRDTADNLYGTTEAGGANNGGTVFKISKTGKYTVLYSFAFPGGSDGADPVGGLIRDSADNLYGTTFYGGGGCTFGCGTVFKLDSKGNETVLYRFTDGADGAFPLGRLLRDAAGNLYGTASGGGNFGCFDGEGCGVLFKLDMTNRETVLYTFTGGADGKYPYAGLVRDSLGNLYGTTLNGGNSGWGVAFKLDATGTETVSHNFSSGSDGAYPLGLLGDAAGNLYGVSNSGGDLNCGQIGCGTVFEIVHSSR
jgi:uncharacterized repeat protein (TIGR03803 family)